MNILLIYPDQMRADAMGCSGNPLIKTPNLDRLATEGVRFTNAYTTYPLCCPFRASIMTGKYAHSNGMVANHHPIRLDQEFLADILKQNGYNTGYIGKWHLNGGKKHDFVPKEERLGFDTFIGFSRGHSYFGSIFYRDDDPTPRTTEKYEPDYQTDHLIEFMEKSLNDPEDKPFFCMICYGPPHPPLHAPDKYLSLYSPDEVPVQANTPEDEESQQKARNFLAKYYGLVTNVDDNIGRVMNWLEEKGIADDTMVIVVSDHGDHAGEHGKFGKRTIYRGSMHVPLIVRYPGVFPAGTVQENLVDPAVDIMPTILDYCGIDIPDAVQGKSFLPLLKGDEAPIRNAVYYEKIGEEEGPERNPVPERGIRNNKWVYVATAEGPLELYDIKNDPLELNNLVDSEKHQDIIIKLDTQLQKHMNDTDDAWDIRAVFPPPDFQTHAEGAAFVKELKKVAVAE